jgi:hypothetical protein
VMFPKQNHGIFHEVPDLVASEVKKFILGGNPFEKLSGF